MNFLSKAYLKYTNPTAYKNYKFLKKLQSAPQPALHHIPKNVVTFKHSGNCGDVIYALPAMYALANGNNIHVYLHLNQPAQYSKMYHPLGNVMLNQQVANMLQPLLLAQTQIVSCTTNMPDVVDYDLDLVRQLPLLLDRGNIARWYFLVYPANYNLAQPWLQAIPDTTLSEAIVIARSHRYHAPGIDYSFLKKYSNVYFVGLENEYSEMKKMIPNITYRPTANFLELANVIAGCKLFIGNQSSPFAIAEGLKVNRLLEVYFNSPNVTVYGDNGFDFCFQPQFEKLVQMRYEAV